jgi:hypothetical protein
MPRASIDENPPPEPENPNKLRELSLVCGLVAVGIAITVGALWVGWEIGGVIP